MPGDTRKELTFFFNLNIAFIVSSTFQLWKLKLIIYSDGEINMVMEYMDGGSLDLVMKKKGKANDKSQRSIRSQV